MLKVGDSLAAPPTAAAHNHENATESDSSAPAPQQPSGAASTGAQTTELPSELVEIAKTADAFNDREEHSEAREYLLSVLPDHPDEVEVVRVCGAVSVCLSTVGCRLWGLTVLVLLQLWRLARSSYALSEVTSEREEKKALVYEGLTFAEKAYAVNADSAASNLWMAVLTRSVLVLEAQNTVKRMTNGAVDWWSCGISAVGDYQDLKDKIAGAYVIRVRVCISLQGREFGLRGSG